MIGIYIAIGGAAVFFLVLSILIALFSHEDVVLLEHKKTTKHNQIYQKLFLLTLVLPEKKPMEHLKSFTTKN